jgi:ComF family protein
VAAVAYAGRVPDWMQRFKYPGSSWSSLDGTAVRVVCSLAADAACLAPGPPPDAVVPVPLHPRRLRARGFNPAALLARAVAQQIARPWHPTALVRHRDTPSQTGLDRRERRRNVRGAFRCASEPRRSVWLVDDVMTTGATLSECARMLRRAGTRRVVAVCVARTPRPVD